MSRSIAHFSRRLVAVLVVGLGTVYAHAQMTPSLEQGLKPYGSYDSSAIDSVNLTNGALMVHIPLVSYPQRGKNLTLSFFIRYNSKGWAIKDDGLSPQGVPLRSWFFVGPGIEVAKDQDIRVEQEFINPLPGHVIEVYTAVGNDGASHTLGNTSSTSIESVDASGIRVDWDPTRPTDLSGATVVDANGVRYTLGAGVGLGILHNLNSHRFDPVSIEDSNGNRINANSATGWTDTLGRLIPGSTQTGSTLKPGVVTTDLTNCPTGTVAARIWNLPGPNGTTSSIKFCYSNQTLQSNFQDSGITDTSTTGQLMTALVLPNLKKWLFSYNTFGDLASITTPQGGTITYVWTTVVLSTAVGGGESRAILSRTMNANDGTGAKTWNYTWGQVVVVNNVNTTTNVVTDPLGNDTIHRMSAILTGGGPFYETQGQVFQGSGVSRSLIKTIDTQYVIGGPNSNGPGPFDLVPSRITTIWPNGQVSQRRLTFDSGATYTDNNEIPQTHPLVYGNVIQEDVFDYANNTPGVVDPTQVTPGPIMRRSLTSYLGLSDANYKALNRLKLVSSTIIQNGIGTRVAETDYQYDTDGNGTLISPLSSGITTQRNTAPPAGLRRGNVTLTSRWLNTSATPIQTVLTYFDTGTLQKSLDPLLHPTTFSYSPTFAGAYLTQTCNALNQCTAANYDSNTGLLTSSTDLNGKSTTYGYDDAGLSPSMRRLTGVVYPTGGGQETICYTDNGGPTCSVSGPPFKVITTTQVTSSLNNVSTVVLDGLARTSQNQLNSDPSGTDFVDTSYDAVGRVRVVSNLYRTLTDPTYGTTTTSFDALNRTALVTRSDGSTVSTVYLGSCTTLTDEAGKTRKSCSDGLGRLIQVFEDPSGLNYETDYQYDALDNLIRVDQKGSSPGNSANWRTRTFTYDSLSRLLTAANPETGTITYSYDAYSNVQTNVSPQANQIGAATTTITYCYEPLHRLASKTYSAVTCPVAAPAVQFAYDGAALSGCTTAPPVPSPADANPVGHRTSMCDGSGATAWTHDALGRTLEEKRTIIGSTAVTKTTNYAYNLDGSLASITYPTGRVITYTLQSGGTCGTGTCTASRMLSAVDTANSINYVTSASYTPHGAITGMKYGLTGTFAGITHTNGYNKRLQPVVISAASPTATILSLSYDFHLGVGDNGNVFQIVNNRDNNRTQNFVYDTLNRIQQANSTGPNWGETFTIDAWGNLTNRGTVAGKTNSEPLNAAPATVKNQLTGFGYDAAGNLTSNGSAAYTYDAENRLLTAGGYTYSYDGDGRRVKRQNGSLGILSWSGLSGNTLDESGLTGSFVREYVFFNGRRVARRDTGNSAVHYFFSDNLGSTSLVTNATGTMAACAGPAYVSGEQETDYYPYGGEYPPFCSTITDQKFKFTGKERDTESGLDNFGARYDASSLGRFMTPDWAVKPTTVPYAVFGDPQTLNLYAYVRNNPLSRADVDGHCADHY